MNKVVFGILLGGVLGAFDGLTALISAPETAPQIGWIVASSSFKGLLLGLIVGLFATKVHNLWAGVLVGAGVGAFLAWLVTLDNPYLWEIVIPGTLVGLVVGFATQRWRARPDGDQATA